MWVGGFFISGFLALVEAKWIENCFRLLVGSQLFRFGEITDWHRRIGDGLNLLVFSTEDIETIFCYQAACFRRRPQIADSFLCGTVGQAVVLKLHVLFAMGARGLLLVRDAVRRPKVPDGLQLGEGNPLRHDSLIGDGVCPVLAVDQDEMRSFGHGSVLNVGCYLPRKSLRR